MNDEVRRRVEMLIRVDGYGEASAAEYPATSRAGELFAIVRTALGKVKSATTEQASSARLAQERTSLKSIAYDRLFDRMQAISTTAQVIALTLPGLEDKFRMPRKPSAQVVLAAGRAFAQDAVPLKPEFVRRALPETFIDDLEAAISEFSDSISERNQSTGARVAATAGADEAIDEAMMAVRELRVIVRNHLRGNRAALAEWESVSHVERRPQRKKAEPPGPAQPASDDSQTPEADR